MKLTTTFVAVALIAVASVSHAQMSYKNFTLETGKGGIELQLSVPDFPITGPMDFSGNKGFGGGQITSNGVSVTGKEARFAAKFGETTILNYHVSLVKTNSKTDSLTNSQIAESFLKLVGLKFVDSKPVETKYPLLADGKNITYEVCAQPVFDTPENEFDCAIIETSVSKDGKNGVAVMATVMETDKNQGGEKTSKRVNTAFKLLASESKAKIKP